jgi:hypothetical protein
MWGDSVDYLKCGLCGEEGSVEEIENHDCIIKIDSKETDKYDK